VSKWDTAPDASLDKLFAAFRAAVANTVDKGTLETYRYHAGHLVRFFADKPGGISKASIADYARSRLGQVKRETVKKERSTLRVFLSWCQEQGHLTRFPEFPPLPKRALGTPSRPPRKPTVVDPDEARAIVAQMPRWSSPRGTGEAFPVRGRFVVAHETGLRPSTLNGLSVPEHYQKGAAVLLVTDDIDKARFGRELPLTTRARVALDEVCPVKGLIFGDHDYRYQIEAAVRKAVEKGLLPADKGRTFSAYDLRHSRATEWAGTGDLMGTAYLLGHKQVTTTNRYAHPGLAAGKKVLDAASGSPTSTRRGLVGVVDLTVVPPSCAKERTRTSTGVTPLAPQGSETPSLRDRAAEIIESAQQDTTVSHSFIQEFGRLVAADAPAKWRLVIALLDGGIHAPRRAVELARMVLEETEAEAEQGEL
jgi:integrase